MTDPNVSQLTEQSVGNLHLEADTNTVEGFVNLVRRGAVRIPDFQRPLRWQAKDVIDLFDSVYHGFPIGSFLLRKAAARAELVRYGPIVVEAPETPAALWVVDGQQRLTALTAGLAREGLLPTTPDDPWVVYYDAEHRRFVNPPRTGEIPSSWVPVSQLLDASSLSEWVFNWAHANDPVRRKSVFDAGARIRQYEIPLYVVETEDEEVLRQIFYRINNSGEPLQWQDVHDALFARAGEAPSTLNGLADALASVGMGRPEEDQLLTCLVAFKGLDVTRSLAEHYRRDSNALRDAVPDALPVIRNVLSFLRANAEIPHLRLLPRTLPIVVLTRFFALFPNPSARNVELLVRWTWRVLFRIGTIDERALLRQGVSSIDADEEDASVQRLLSLVGNSPVRAFRLPDRFDARAADSRLALLGLASLQPLSLLNGERVVISDLVEQSGADAFRKIFPRMAGLGSGPANRIILPEGKNVEAALESVIEHDGTQSDTLASHGIDAAAAQAFLGGEDKDFLALRKAVIEESVNSLGDRLAAWGRNDRPSIAHLLAQIEDAE